MYYACIHTCMHTQIDTEYLRNNETAYMAYYWKIKGKE